MVIRCGLHILHYHIMRLPHYEFIIVEDISKALSDKYVTNNNPEVIQYLNLGKYCSEVVSLNRNLYLASSSIWQSEEQIIDISYGFEHTLLLTKQGKVYSWGTGR